jgi:hypothetical protein
MYFYPLIGGALFFFIIGIIIPEMGEQPEYRVFYNIYNAGIAVLTVGSFLKGFGQ